MRRFSVFLTPSENDFIYAGNLIRGVCGKYDEPPFEPHVTIYSGALSNLDAMKKAVSGAVAGIRPFSLRVRRIGWSEEYFRTLFIEFEESAILRGIYERLQAGGEVDPAYELVPHLSLLYKDMPLRDKESLARRVHLDRSEIHFDEVKIISPRNEAAGWRDTGQWQTLFRVRLREPDLKKPIRAVLFDFGGVLAEEGFREGLHVIAWRHGLDQQKIYRMAMDAIYDSGYILGKGSEADFWTLLGDRTGIQGEVSALSNEIVERFVLRPRMLGAVRKLRAKGIITAILSDQTDWLARLDRRDHFFREFDRVFNSYDLGKGKRDPGLFDDVVAALGIAPQEALFIDDMVWNVERAGARRLQTRLFTDEERLLGELERL